MRSERAGAVNRASKRPRKRPQPAPARVGASCERCPRIRPSLVVDPTRAGAAFWACVRVSKRLSNSAIPRAEGQCERSPKESAELCVAPRRGGRLLRWLRLPLICASRFVRISREVGGNAGGEAAQNRARQFRVKQVCSESAALGFPPPAGVAPLSNERDDAAHDLPANLRTIPHRAASAVAPAILAPRGINEDALGRPKRARESCPA